MKKIYFGELDAGDILVEKYPNSLNTVAGLFLVTKKRSEDFDILCFLSKRILFNCQLIERNEYYRLN